MPEPRWMDDPRYVYKTNGCWFWLRALDKGGYGSYRGKRAHQLAYGKTKPGNVVRHTCDTRNCVRPSHLIEGSYADNAHDRDRAGHTRTPYAGITHCKRGHEFTPENTRYYGKLNYRYCRTCRREWQRNNKRKPHHTMLWIFNAVTVA